MPTDELDQTMQQNAQGPKEAHGGSGGMQQHPLPDQIAADRYLAAKRAMKRKHRGLRVTKIGLPGGA